MKTERKAIAQLSILTILVVMGLLGELLVVSNVYRYHSAQVLLQNEAHAERMKQLGSEEHDLKRVIIDVEALRRAAAAGM